MQMMSIAAIDSPIDVSDHDNIDVAVLSLINTLILISLLYMILSVLK